MMVHQFGLANTCHNHVVEVWMPSLAIPFWSRSCRTAPCRQLPAWLALYCTADQAPFHFCRQPQVSYIVLGTDVEYATLAGIGTVAP